MLVRLLKISVGLLFTTSCFATDAITAEQLKKATEHPRLLLTDAAVEVFMKDIAQDPLRQSLHKQVIGDATIIRAKPVVSYRLAGVARQRLLPQAQEITRNILTCAAAYRLSGERVFAERAIAELVNAADFPDWNPDHFLDTAEMSMAVALGYDWLYRELTAEARSKLISAIKKHIIAYADKAYTVKKGQDKNMFFAQVRHNWNPVCNGGMIAAALTIADSDPELACSIINRARQSLDKALAYYSPNGSYAEGPSYWLYATSYNVLSIALMESTIGDDLGISRASGFDRTVNYRLYAVGTTGEAFNYGDADAGVLKASPFYTMLANRFQNTYAQVDSRRLLQEELDSPAPALGRFLALHAVWFPAPHQKQAPPPPLDAFFDGRSDIAVLRSSWNDANAIYVGFKLGILPDSHAHMDIGSFVMDCNGVRWASDLGPDSYDLPEYSKSDQNGRRWSYFRLNNYSHNTLTIGDNLLTVPSKSHIFEFKSSQQFAYAIADMTAAYKPQAKSIYRGIALIDRCRVLVQDEIKDVEPGTRIRWNMTTKAKIILDNDQRAALLQLDGQELRIQAVSSPSGIFSVHPARPTIANEAQNKEYQQLQYSIIATNKDATISIQLTPIGKTWPSVKNEKMLPLSEWKETTVVGEQPSDNNLKQ